MELRAKTATTKNAAWAIGDMVVNFVLLLREMLWFGVLKLFTFVLYGTNGWYWLIYRYSGTKQVLSGVMAPHHRPSFWLERSIRQIIYVNLAGRQILAGNFRFLAVVCAYCWNNEYGEEDYTGFFFKMEETSARGDGLSVFCHVSWYDQQQQQWSHHQCLM